jgi:hypothetical protein
VSKVILENGAELEMTLGSFAEAQDLLQVITKSLKDSKVSLNDDIGDLNTIKDIFLSLLSDKEIPKAILPLIKRTTLNGIRITSFDFFEDEKYRECYIPILWEVAKFNLMPFMKGLFSKLQGISPMIKSSQK